MSKSLSYRENRRLTCTPISEAADTLGALAEIWETWYPKKDFLETFFKPMWDDPKTSGEDQLKEIREVETMKDWFGEEPITEKGRSAAVKLAILMAVCAFCVQTMKAKRDSGMAWSYVSDAKQWLGILQGYMSGGSGLTLATDLAKRGAYALHAENRAMKSVVFEWCDQNMSSYPSMDAAAEAIAGKVVPLKFRTVREWLTEWRKSRAVTDLNPNH
jgi:hypothetical protein